jgi:hypothetical protein
MGAALIGLLALAAPPYFQRTTGTELGAMVTRGVKVVSQLPIDVVGTPAAERVVLLGQTGPDGVVSAVGVAVLDTSSGLRVLGSLRLPTNTSYSITFGSTPVDLDGDGKVEIPLDTVASEPGLFRFEETLYVRMCGDALRVVYTLAREIDRPPRREARSVKVVGLGVIEETIRTRESGTERRAVVRLTYDGLEHRFRP